MAKSILLLFERKNEGRGPTIPLRNRVEKVTAVGIGERDGVVIRVRHSEYDLRYEEPLRTIVVKNGEHRLDEPIEPGVHLRAELFGSESLATVWVE